MLFVVSMQQRS